MTVSVSFSFSFPSAIFDDAVEYITYRRKLPPPVYNPRRLAELPIPIIAGPDVEVDGEMNVTTFEIIMNPDVNPIDDVLLPDPEARDETPFEVVAVQQSVSSVALVESYPDPDEVVLVRDPAPVIKNNPIAVAVVQSIDQPESPYGYARIATGQPADEDNSGSPASPGLPTEDVATIKLEPIPVFEMARANSVEFDQLLLDEGTVEIDDDLTMTVENIFPMPLKSTSEGVIKRENDEISGNKSYGLRVSSFNVD